MAFFDKPLEELQTYKPPRDEQPDFDAFWQESLKETRRYPLNARFEVVDYGLSTLKGARLSRLSKK